MMRSQNLTMKAARRACGHDPIDLLFKLDIPDKFLVERGSATSSDSSLDLFLDIQPLIHP